jgi:drug/metabolite transporter (DMT)-like permease
VTAATGGLSGRHFLLLLLLAAIWGSSFLFMRIAVPQLGPGWMLSIRLLSAALFLWLVTRVLQEPLHAGRHWRHYLILGLLNTALPWLAFAWAAQQLPAAILAILNSTAPLWGLLVGFLWRGKAITRPAVLGLLCGMGGVAVLVGGGTGQSIPLIAAMVCLCASLSYGLATSYAEFAGKVPPLANAHGSLWAAVLLTLPLLPLVSPPVSLSVVPVSAALALGLLCSGAALLLYYHLIATIGAPSTMTVGYLIPLWGVFWGWLFLDERVGWNTLLGAGLVLTGTALVTGLRIHTLLRRWAVAAGIRAG